MKARILAILGAVILGIGSGIVGGQAAYADPQAQYCNNGYCLNAWNEGPYVNAYHTNVVNNDFSAFQNSSSGYENIEYTGPGPYQNQCIGDYGNSSTDARAGLGGFCRSGQIAWGANFQLEACNNGDSGWAFKNVHWGGYLTPNAHSNGSPFYLNSATKTCYQALGPG
jgi:hypothetical protein